MPKIGDRVQIRPELDMHHVCGKDVFVVKGIGPGLRPKIVLLCEHCGKDDTGVSDAYFKKYFIPLSKQKSRIFKGFKPCITVR